jgi:hypothetical protein
LESIERVNQTEWKTDVVLPSVSFAPLILPSQESVKDLEALEIGEKIHIIYIGKHAAPHLDLCTVDVYSHTIPVAVEPHSLKQYCRLAVLKYLEREKYHRICDLPLPKHLKVRVGTIPK